MIHGGDIYTNEIEVDYSVNLNPYKMPESVRTIIDNAIYSGIDNAGVYPDIKQRRVREALAKLENLSIDNIVAGSGASEMIMAVTRAVNPKKALIILPTFYGYIHGLNSLDNCEISKYYLKKENEYKLTNDFLDCITNDIDIIYLTNPSNPIGQCIDDSLLIKILQKAKKCATKILLDESFYNLSNAGLFKHTFLDNNDEFIYDNLYIVKTFTKFYAKPGIRAGYVISDKNNINKLVRQLPEWNLSSVAERLLIAGALCLDKHLIFDSINYINSEREYLTKELQMLVKKVYRSDTSYIFLEDDRDIYNLLLKEKILIRDCSNFEGLSKGYYRIAVRNHTDNQKLVNVLKTII